MAVGNLITSERRGEDQYLQLSNGSTTVLLSVLLLSGSDLADTVWQQELVTWLAEHDQEIFGLGVVGFDLDDIAWDAGDFITQRDFFLRMIDHALAGHRWDELSYQPAVVNGQLRRLRELVVDYRPVDAGSPSSWRWWSVPQQLTTCARHRVFMHANGCLLCHDSE